jgi:hypothetical protein
MDGRYSFLNKVWTNNRRPTKLEDWFVVLTEDVKALKGTNVAQQADLSFV